MSWEIGLAIFAAICTAIGTFCAALTIIVAAVYFTIKKELQPLILRLDRLEKDETSKDSDIAEIRKTLQEISNKIFSKDALERMISIKIMECQKTCPLRQPDPEKKKA